MTDPNYSTCDGVLLDRYLDGDLSAKEMAVMKVHLGGCAKCRGQVAVMTAFARDMHDRVKQATDAGPSAGAIDRIAAFSGRKVPVAA